jgi:hypothetical protein
MLYCIGQMVVVVFASGRRLILFEGKSARRLKPGVKVYDATGTELFRSDSDVLSVTLYGHPITATNPIAILQEAADDDRPI